jgi:CAAX prenyl protease-like protein
MQIPLGRFNLKAFLIAGVIFGVGHYEWLPGILCAFVYQGLVCRKDRLGDAITAHAITNFLLALWVVFRPAYYFW